MSDMDTLDWNRLRSGDRRALNPDNQPLFDKFYQAAAPKPDVDAVERVREACAEWLHGRADSAYCKGMELSKRALCLGEEHKIKTGEFTQENLKALEETRATFGAAFALWEAAKHIRALDLAALTKDKP